MVLRRHFIDLDFKHSLSCNFLGHLEKDKEACIAVTGCPGDTMQFTIHSSHNIESNKFVLHPSGNVETIQSVEDTSIDGKMDPESSDEKGELSRSSTCTRDDTIGCKPLPPTNLLTLKINYDDSFSNSFYDDYELKQYVADLVTHTQSYFCFGSSFGSENGLGTKFDLKVCFCLKELSLSTFELNRLRKLSTKKVKIGIQT